MHFLFTFSVFFFICSVKSKNPSGDQTPPKKSSVCVKKMICVQYYMTAQFSVWQHWKLKTGLGRSGGGCEMPSIEVVKHSDVSAALCFFDLWLVQQGLAPGWAPDREEVNILEWRYLPLFLPTRKKRKLQKKRIIKRLLFILQNHNERRKGLQWTS